MSRQRVLGAALVWLVVVASVSALVWVVISRAGDDLVSSGQPLLTSEGDPSSAPPSPSTRPSRTPSQSPSRAPSNDASATSSPSTTPTPSTPSASPSEPSPSATPDPPTEQPSTPAIAERRTWQGQAGSIVAACDSTGIRLVSAQPANGFRAEAQNEDGMLKIDFEGREDESGTDVSVVARCVGGVPSFVVRGEDD